MSGHKKLAEEGMRMEYPEEPKDEIRAIIDKWREKYPNDRHVVFKNILEKAMLEALKEAGEKMLEEARSARPQIPSKDISEIPQHERGSKMKIFWKREPEGTMHGQDKPNPNVIVAEFGPTMIPKKIGDGWILIENVADEDVE